MQHGFDLLVVRDDGISKVVGFPVVFPLNKIDDALRDILPQVINSHGHFTICGPAYFHRYFIISCIQQGFFEKEFQKFKEQKLISNHHCIGSLLYNYFQIITPCNGIKDNRSFLYQRLK